MASNNDLTNLSAAVYTDYAATDIGKSIDVDPIWKLAAFQSDPNTGFYGAIYQHNLGNGQVETVAAIRGMELLSQDAISVSQIRVGQKPGAFDSATGFYDYVKGNFGSNVTYTGHSEGGAEVGYIAAVAASRAEVFTGVTFGAIGISSVLINEGFSQAQIEGITGITNYMHPNDIARLIPGQIGTQIDTPFSPGLLERLAIFSPLILLGDSVAEHLVSSYQRSFSADSKSILPLAYFKDAAILDAVLNGSTTVVNSDGSLTTSITTTLFPGGPIESTQTINIQLDGELTSTRADSTGHVTSIQSLTINSDNESGVSHFKNLNAAEEVQSEGTFSIVQNGEAFLTVSGEGFETSVSDITIIIQPGADVTITGDGNNITAQAGSIVHVVGNNNRMTSLAGSDLNSLGNNNTLYGGSGSNINYSGSFNTISAATGAQLIGQGSNNNLVLGTGVTVQSLAESSSNIFSSGNNLNFASSSGVQIWGNGNSFGGSSSGVSMISNVFTTLVNPSQYIYPPQGGVYLIGGGWNKSINEDGEETLEGSTLPVYVGGRYVVGDQTAVASGFTVSGVYGGTGRSTFLAGGSAGEFHGGFGENILLGQDGNYTFNYSPTNPGNLTSGKIFSGNGNNTIAVGNGDSLIQLGNGNNLVAAISGNNTIAVGNGVNSITAYDGDNIISFGAGQNTATLWGGNNTVVAGSGTLDVNLNGYGNNTIFGSASQRLYVFGQLFPNGTLPPLANSLMVGGSGDDTIHGGWGNNTISGGGGNDVLVGGNGNGNNILDGGDGNDYLTTFQSSSRSATMYGGSGDDRIEGNLSDETIYGGDGSDTLSGTGGSDYIDGGAGNDVLRAVLPLQQGTHSLDSTLIGGAGDDLLIGSGYGGSHVTYLFNLGDGHDTIDDGSNNQGGTIQLGAGIAPSDVVMQGGAGENPDVLLQIQNTSDSITLTGFIFSGFYDHPFYGPGSGGGQIVFADGTVWDSTMVMSQIQGVTLPGTDGSDTLKGSVGSDLITAGAGDDYLFGQTGNDTLVAGSGTDTLDGWAGDDVLIGGSGSTIFVFGLGDFYPAFYGHDTIQASTFTGLNNDTIQLGFGVLPSNVTLQADATGNVTLQVQGTSQVLSINNFLYSSFAEGAGRITFADGTAWDSSTILATTTGFALTGAGGSDLLTGTVFIDTLNGGAGNDTLAGDKGNDTYVFQIGDGQDTVIDTVTPLQGNTLVFSPGITASDLTFAEDQTQHTLSIGYSAGGDSVTLLNFDPNGVYGSLVAQTLSFADGSQLSMSNQFPLRSGLIVGTLYNDYIQIPSGNSTVQAGAGNDTVLGTDGSDSIYGEDGNDTLYAGSGSTTLDGGAGDDWLEGGSDINVLQGGAGNDRLIAASGPTTLDGGTGNDTLMGGSASDTYMFRLGDGQDIIFASNSNGSNHDTVRFGSGISASDVNLQTDTYGNVTLQIQGATDSVFISNFLFSSFARGTGQIMFEDGTVWDSTTILNFFPVVTLTGTDGSDYLLGRPFNDLFIGGGGDDFLDGTNTINDTMLGGDGNDTLIGGTGVNNLHGDAGNDQLYAGAGPATLDGGAGDDMLFGGNSNDIYVFGIGDGHDTIISSTSDDSPNDSPNDTIRLGSGISPSSVTLQTDIYGDLLLGFIGATDQLTVQNYFSDPQYQTERIEFADGTVWDTATILGQTPGLVLTDTTGGVYLQGSPLSDTLSGAGGNDTLAGGMGNDIYLFDRGHGQNTISESNYSGNDMNTIQMAPGITPTDVTLQTDIYGSLLLAITGTSDQLVIPYYFLDSQYQVEQVAFADGTIWSTAAIFSQTSGLVLTDGSGDGYLQGSPVADTLSGGGGNDYLAGGRGDDIYAFNLGDDIDTIQDVASTGEGNRVQFGSGITLTDLTATQNQAAQTLTIQVGSSGTDQLVLTNFDPTGTNGSLVVETLAFADGSTVSLASLLGLGGPVATNGDDTITTGAGNDVVDALGGNDIVDTGAGNDTITGGTGNDQLTGGTGDDTYIYNLGDGVDTITDTAAPGEGNTMAFGTGISSTDLTLGLGSLLIRVGTNGDAIHLTPFDPNDALGTHAIETFRFADGTTLSYSQLVARGFDLTGTAGTDALTGTNVVDRISGLAGNDTVQSGAGDDVLDGGAGADTLIGGQGNDTYVVDNVGDVVTEQLNEGTDTVQSVISYTLGANVENLTLMGTSALDGTGNELANVLIGNEAANVLAGGDGNDSLLGNGGNDILNGGLGADVLQGGDGDDLLYVDAADTTVSGGAGFDVVNVVGPAGVILDVAAANIEVAIGSDGNDTFNGAGAITALSLDGGAGTDVLTGGSGNDVLAGGEGNDQLTGNAGNDVLNGGAGADVLNGGVGDDLLYIDAADTSISGGAGHDALSVLPGSAGVTLDVAAASIEDAMGGDGNDTFDGTTATVTLLLQGNGGNDTLLGGAGTDALNGGSGNDLLNGGVGADTLVGGTGDDTYVVDDLGDQVTENLNEGIDTVQSRISVGLGANVENLTLLGTAAIDGTGNSANNVLMGNIAANVLDGGLGADTMVGGAGNDTYLVDDAGDVVTELANEGTDAVQSAITYTLSTNVENLTLAGTATITGTGNGLDNVLTGNSAANTLTGGAGNDTYVVSVGDTVIEATNQGLDTVVSDVTWTLGANLENLTLTGGAAINGTGNTLNNVLTGNSGNNTLNGGTGADQMAGGGGNDTYVLDNAGDVVTELANEGTDLVQSSLSYSLGANVENVTLTGTAAITATGNSLNNVLAGNSGANVLTGGAGDDTYVVGAGDTVIEQLNEGTDTVQSVITWTLGANLENLTLTGATAINGTGNTLNNVLTGNSAANVLDGGAGDDQLTGGAGADTLLGGSGNDLYVVDNVGDVVTEQLNEGLDTVQSSVSYTLSANVEQLTLIGTAAITATGNSLNNVLAGNSGANVLDGGTGADTLVGGIGNDTYVVDNAGDVVTENANEGTDTVQASVNYTLGANLENLTLTGTAAITGTGNAANNVLTGNSGNNVLDGGGGTDTLRGGVGDDTYVVDDTTDVVTENLNEGTDTVQSAISYTLGVNVENLTLTGPAALTATGNTLNNVLAGNSAANTLNGGTGADSLIGGQGDDTYVVDNLGDVVTEQQNEGLDTVQSSVSYTLSANVENLALTGTGAITATGNSLNNLLTGNAGANVLDGGTGTDTLVGGAGNDTYVVDDLGDVVTELLNQGTDTVQSAVSYTLGSDLENLTLTGTAILSGTGNSLNNVLTGNSAANVLTGGDGNDTLDGGVGADSLLGGLGNDTYLVDSGSDIVTEQLNEGTDTIQSSVTYTLAANVEHLTLTGTAAVNATGNALANTLTGNSAANVLTGGGGNDTYVVSTGDTVVENLNEGTDTVQSDVTWTLGANLENLTLTGTAAVNGTGNSVNNTLRGNSAANLLTGGAGNDTYVVSTGDTVVEQANEGTDTVQSDVSWTLGANLENLTLTGTAAINAAGNGLANVLTGNGAANQLAGGTGNDTLRGGLGNDTYLVNRGEGQDLIAENDATVGNADTLLYGATINPLDLVLSRQANDLRLAIHGSTDYVTVQNWYSTPTTAQVETIQAGNGQALLSTQVDQLIQAMAGFTTQTGLTWDQAIDQRPQDVQTVLAASWQ